MNNLQHYGINFLNNNIPHIFYISTMCFIILIGTWYINSLIQKTIIQAGTSNNFEKTFTKALQNISYVLIYTIGGILVLENLNIHMSALFRTLGALAIGISFALQNTIANLAAGIFLLSYKPFFIGDYITSNSPIFEGKIIDITLQRTTLEYQGDIVLIPNFTLYNAIITIKKTRKV